MFTVIMVPGIYLALLLLAGTWSFCKNAGPVLFTGTVRVLISLALIRTVRVLGTCFTSAVQVLTGHSQSVLTALLLVL